MEKLQNDFPLIYWNKKKKSTIYLHALQGYLVRKKSLDDAKEYKTTCVVLEIF